MLRDRKNRALLLGGVTLEDPASTFVDADVTIGADTVIGPGVLLEGTTSIGEGCRIHAGCRLTDTHVGDDVTILDHCVLVGLARRRAARASARSRTSGPRPRWARARTSATSSS